MSRDTSCADHEIARRVRDLAGLKSARRTHMRSHGGKLALWLRRRLCHWCRSMNT
jgi:hypothetical protein